MDKSFVLYYPIEAVSSRYNLHSDSSNLPLIFLNCVTQDRLHLLLLLQVWLDSVAEERTASLEHPISASLAAAGPRGIVSTIES